MAKGDGQTLEKLYIELGLDLSKLQTDILAADKTVTENLGRLNREKNVIKLRMEADIASLDRVKDAAKILEIQEKALNQQLALQKDRMNILEAAYRQVASNANATAVAVNKAEQAFLREKIAVGQLEQQLKALASQKGSPAPTNNLLSGYQNLKGNVAGTINEITSALNGLQGASNSVDGALTSVLGIVGRIPPLAAAATAALVGIPLIFKGIENSIVDLARASAASGDATYVMSRGMQMSIADAAKFSTNAKVAGAQVNDLAMAVKNVQRQVARGGEDSRAAEWLKRYGESAYDASGNLKDLNEMTFSLSRALKRAQADGKGAEFVLNVFRNVSADAITAIEDWADVNAQAASIVKAGLANPKLAHEVQGNLNAMNVQSAQLGTSFTNALLPVANEIVPRLTDRIGKMTQVIKDNKDFILELGKDFAKVWSGVETVVEAVGRGVAAIGGVAKNIYMTPKKVTQDLVDKYINDSEIKNAEDLLKKELMKRLPQERAAIYSSTYLYDLELRKYEPIAKAIGDAREKIAEEKKALEKELYSVADFSSASADRVKFEQNTELSKQAESIKKILQEASDIQYKLSHTDYENKKLDLLQWRQDMLNQAGTSEEQRVAIEKLYLAKLDKLNQEVTQKIAEHWKNAADIEYELTHTAFEKQIRDIEQWEEAMRDKADTAEEIAGIIAESAAKEAQAFEREMDRIKGKLQSLDDKIFEIDHSQYENDLRRIQQEYIKQVQEYQQSGLLPLVKDKLDYLYNRQVQELNKRAKEGGDYTKSPEGAMQRGGNGITVIEEDRIIDDGLSARRAEIGLLVDENQLRQHLGNNLSQEAKEKLAAIQATRNLADAQKILAEATTQTASGFQIIEGDEVTNNPQAGGVQMIAGDEIISGVQEFDTAVQNVTSTVEGLNQPVNDLQSLSATMAQTESDFQESLKRMTENLPADYFKTLADNSKAVSDMQFGLTESTMDLIYAQDNLADLLSKLPKLESLLPTSNQQGTNGLMNLSTQGAYVPQQQGSGMNLGFDWDVFGGLAGLAALIPHPAAKALAIGGSIGAGLGIGTFNAENPTSLQPSTQSFETIVTPLNSIQTAVSNILSELQNRQGQQITISPTNSINLGGAYVFDNAMKSQLVDDITTEIVDEITKAVQSATSRANYSYT